MVMETASSSTLHDYHALSRLPTYVQAPATSNYSHLAPEKSKMDHGRRQQNSTPDEMTSAADAMLKLSNSSPPPRSHFPVHPSYQDQSGAESVAQERRNDRQVSPSQNNSALSLALHSTSTTKMNRRQREFIPDFRKDDTYWSKRRKNNEAAKRSREKRRINDMVMGSKIMELTTENSKLRSELQAIKRHFGIPVDEQFPFTLTASEEQANKDALAKLTTQIECSVQNSEMLFSGSVTPKTEQMPMSQQSPHHQQEQQRMLPHMTNAVFPTVRQALEPVTQNPQILSSQPLSSMTDRSPSRPKHAVPFCQPSVDGPYSGSYSESGHPHTHLPPNYSQAALNSQAPQPNARAPYPDGELTDAARFHQNMKIHNICRPISPDGSSNSQHSLKIAFSGGSSSNENSGDEKGPEPINLAVQRNIELNGDGSPSSSSVSGRRKGIPHKLRHKYAFSSNKDTPNNIERIVPAVDFSAGPTPPDQMETYPESDSDRSFSSSISSSSVKLAANGTPRQGDGKYMERRKKNNMAARKCRENRRLVNQMRVAKSSVLETENVRLKEELQELSAEVMSLKQWIDRKNEAKVKGEKFDLPPLEDVQMQDGNHCGAEAAS